MDSTGDRPLRTSTPPGPPPPPAFTAVPRTFQREEPAAPLTLSWLRYVWLASFAALAVTIALALVNLGAVRTALESGLAAQNPGTSHQNLSDTVLITLLGSAAAAVLLALAEAMCLVQLHARSAGARNLLAALGILNIGGLVVVWRLLTDAGAAGGAVLRWGPVAQGTLIVAGLALAFAPPVGRWLSSRG